MTRSQGVHPARVARNTLLASRRVPLPDRAFDVELTTPREVLRAVLGELVPHDNVVPLGVLRVAFKVVPELASRYRKAGNERCVVL
jgi:hypothetical protein